MMAYIARCKCGCGAVVFAMLDDLAFVKGNAKEVAKAIREGYHIERLSEEALKKEPWGCRKKKA